MKEDYNFFANMDFKNLQAPFIDRLIDSCQRYPEVKNESDIKHLLSVFDKLCCLKKQGDDEFRNIWISAERGEIEDFGDFDEYLEAGEVNDKKDFEDLWQYYYPDKNKWYNFAITKYSEVFYFYLDSKLTLQFKADNCSNELVYDFHTKLIDWLLIITDEIYVLIQKSIKEYNDYINVNLPYKKRTGRILRSDFGSIFPEAMLDFKTSIPPEMMEILKKIKVLSESETFGYLSAISAGDFYRFCEIGYDANKYFDKSDKILTPKEKYFAMADGRDCGLRNLDETSFPDFQKWYETEKNCGGHPWEICSGGNSTHISLFVCRHENGWYFRLEGCSRARVIETIKIAIAFYSNKIPFILGKAEEIYRMACGGDFIGIVPETVTPRYCHGFFPADDKIMDFINLGTEKSNEIINKAFWYPLLELKLIN